jgi:hypothetical protein
VAELAVLDLPPISLEAPLPLQRHGPALCVVLEAQRRRRAGPTRG